MTASIQPKSNPHLCVEDDYLLRKFCSVQIRKPGMQVLRVENLNCCIKTGVSKLCCHRST